MLSCISCFDFIPLDPRDRRLPRGDDSRYKTGERYADLSVEIGPVHVVR